MGKGGGRGGGQEEETEAAEEEAAVQSGKEWYIALLFACRNSGVGIRASV